MGKTLTEKILSDHLVEGELETGEEIGIEIDQVLTQDTTGTLVWLQFEALGLDEVQTELAAQYCDHQTYQFDFKNSDDHRFLRSAAGTFGAHFSRPGNGICHQVHKERFAAPGKTMLGSDSHTPTPGGIGELAIGSGGLDVAVAMGGGPYYIEMPEVVSVRLEGELPEWATAKDVILELLRRALREGRRRQGARVHGAGGRDPSPCPSGPPSPTWEPSWARPPPSSRPTRTREEFLSRLDREDEYVELSADDDAEYADEIIIDLDDLEPLIAKPSMPDNVVPVREVAGDGRRPGHGRLLHQRRLRGHSAGREDARRPRGRQAHRDDRRARLEAGLRDARPRGLDGRADGGRRQLLRGDVRGLHRHRPRPRLATRSRLRTFNRNFEGRSGIEDDSVYLCSPEVATAAALNGEIIDPRDLADELGDLEDPGFEMADVYSPAGSNDADIIAPDNAVDDGLMKGPNIGEVPLKDPLDSHLGGPAS